MDTQRFAYSSISHQLAFPPSSGEPLPLIGSPSDRPFSLRRYLSRVTSHIRKIAQGLRKKRQDLRGQGGAAVTPGDSYQQATTISALPDNVLLQIFCFYKEDYKQPVLVWKWHVLVHVCRRWRHVVFASPLRLDLRILCPSRTPVGKNLDIWPALPIVIDGYDFDPQHGNNASFEDNIVPALEHADRVCDVRLNATGSKLEKITTAMQQPFPVLTRLRISSSDSNAPVLPAEFLGGSAPRLQSIDMFCIPFPALPTLLLSTGDLTRLELRKIPRTGYISPAAMAVGLAALPGLREFTIHFQSATPHPDRIHPPPVTRTVLPAFAIFHFWGASEYLEDLVARIDAPQLKEISVSFWNQLVDFQVVQLPMFIDRSTVPRLTQVRYAEVLFHPNCVNFSANYHANFTRASPDTLSSSTEVHCEGVDWQVSHMAEVLSSFSATLSDVAHLALKYKGDRLKDAEDVEWLHILHQFSAVQLLRVSDEIAGHVALALEGISGDAVAEVLPSLDLICLMGKPASSIEKFVAARQLSGRPVTVIDKELEFLQRVKERFSE